MPGPQASAPPALEVPLNAAGNVLTSCDTADVDHGGI
jgi:hypothetical protein